MDKQWIEDNFQQLVLLAMLVGITLYSIFVKDGNTVQSILLAVLTGLNLKGTKKE